MSAPTPVANPYVACVGQSGTVGGNAVKFTGGGITINAQSDDMTNNQGGGWTEKVTTTLTGDVNMTIAWTGDLQLLAGQVYPVLVNVATMPTFAAGTFTAPTPVVTTQGAFAGNVFIDSISAVKWDVKSGFKVDIKATSQGQCTYLV